MRKIFILLVIALSFAFPATAQDTTIEYGQTVTGEITNREFEVPFDFEGSEGDVLIILMAAVDTLGDLNSPEIILLDEEGEIIGDTSGAFSINGALLAIELPASGNYTILASRVDGRAGDSVGEFTLELINPPALTLGEPMTDTISSEGRSNFYVIHNDGTDMTLSYSKQEGDFSPQLGINVINEDYDLRSVVSVGGGELVTATVNVPTTNDLYVVSLEEALFDFNFDEVTADYELTLSAAE